MKDSELIEHLGGPTKVAELLKFDMPKGVQRVQNWLKRGIPAQVKIDFPTLFLADIHLAGDATTIEGCDPPRPVITGIEPGDPDPDPDPDPDRDRIMADGAKADLIKPRCITTRRGVDHQRLAVIAGAGQGV